MAGVTRWSPVDDRPFGCGARYIARLQVGSAPVGALIEIVEFEEPCDLAWTSVTGLDHRGRWRLRHDGPDRTRVSLRLAYQAPGGILGLVADRVAAPMVRRLIDESLASLKEQVEGRRVPRRRPFNPLDALATVGELARVALSAGIVRPERPDRIVGAAEALRRWGLNPAAAVAVSAARFPDEPAVIDERGRLTYRELDARSDAVAAGLRRLGVEAGTAVGILCRNHRGFVEATVALFKLGADVVFLNTGFSGPQVKEVCEHEGIAAVVHDEEFADAVAGTGRTSVVAWTDGGGARRRRGGPRRAVTLDELAAEVPAEPPAPPERPGRMIILTSGTTGRPKGAPRSQPDNLTPAMSILSRIPLRVRDTTVIAPPMFHAWGFAHLILGLSLSSTLVLRRRFEPAAILEDVARHRARVLVAVPVMLERVLSVPDDVRAGCDTSSLEVVAVSGSALSGRLAARFMDTFGEVLYNLYGSTEVAWATIADPSQLRAAPGTAGTVPRGTTVRIFDEHGIELPRGQRGRIFVGSGMTFTGYTGGGGKAVLHGLVDSGDVGRFDGAGRLFVEGRGDDMIVSGGENVFPQEVEELLTAHADIADAAVLGVEDAEFGERLAAFVVPRPGADLTAEAVRGHVRSHLARYKVPRDVEFVDELPRNSTGKVLKRELRDRHNGSGAADRGGAAGTTTAAS